MVRSAPDLSRDVRITNELGLHARAAAKIAKTVQKATAGVWITKNGDRVDASSVVDILTLYCEKGTRITISIEDPVDVSILDAVAEMVEAGFGE